MEMNLIQVGMVAAAECVRQQVGLDELTSLLEAYDYTYHVTSLNEGTIQQLAELVEARNASGYRKIPVVFKSGGFAANANTIPAAMENLCSHLLALKTNADKRDWVRQYLGIHPWIDGNGRTAWLIYNKLMGTMDAPNFLPDFKFGE